MNQSGQKLPGVAWSVFEKLDSAEERGPRIVFAGGPKKELILPEGKYEVEATQKKRTVILSLNILAGKTLKEKAVFK